MNACANNLSLKRQNTSSGFTLIELMVTIAVLAIIVSIAAPNISTQLANQRVKSTAATFANALKEAKVESVIRRQNVEVIYNANATPKTLTLRANSNNIAIYNINSKSSVTPTINPSSVTSIVFRPDKTIANGATVLYTVCDSGSNSETARQVSLSRIGNVDTKNAGRC
ncbi:prepilin-type N-terminal cleavage/methylation domain-containing protein [Psychrobacter sp. B38]|uniref:pilus assembly FimT family protein n=1 Tax=Psychrobacter sp. B38 TaxID=3143538 RepID=UPI00320CAD54